MVAQQTPGLKISPAPKRQTDTTYLQLAELTTIVKWFMGVTRLELVATGWQNPRIKIRNEDH